MPLLYTDLLLGLVRLVRLNNAASFHFSLNSLAMHKLLELHASAHYARACYRHVADNKQELGQQHGGVLLERLHVGNG